MKLFFEKIWNVIRVLFVMAVYFEFVWIPLLLNLTCDMSFFQNIVVFVTALVFEIIMVITLKEVEKSDEKENKD